MGNRASTPAGPKPITGPIPPGQSETPGESAFAGCPNKCRMYGCYTGQRGVCQDVGITGDCSGFDRMCMIRNLSNHDSALVGTNNMTQYLKQCSGKQYELPEEEGVDTPTTPTVPSTSSTPTVPSTSSRPTVPSTSTRPTVPAIPDISAGGVEGFGNNCPMGGLIALLLVIIIIVILFNSQSK